jgi:hypothetical protein
VVFIMVSVLTGCKSPQERAVDDFNRHMRVMETMMADMQKSMEAFERENH